MYFYIYDDFVSTPKLHVTLSGIEAKLALLEIKGPVSRLHTLTNIKEVVRRAIIRGATTIVVVGDDRILLKVLNVLPDKNIAIGLIPLGPQLTLAKKLNISDVKSGIEAVAGRKLVTINTGMVNKRIFLQKVDITAGSFTAILDGSLTVKADHEQSLITVMNPQLTSDPKSTPTLEVRLMPLKGRWSLGRVKAEQISKLNFKKLKLKSQTFMKIVIDDAENTESKIATIDIVKNAAKLIVGRERPSVKE